MGAVADWSSLCNVKAHQLHDGKLTFMSIKQTSAMSCRGVTQQFVFKCTKSEQSLTGGLNKTTLIDVKPSTGTLPCTQLSYCTDCDLLFT